MQQGYLNILQYKYSICYDRSVLYCTVVKRVSRLISDLTRFSGLFQAGYLHFKLIRVGV